MRLRLGRDSGPTARPAEREADTAARTVRDPHAPPAHITTEAEGAGPATVPGVGHPLDTHARAILEHHYGTDLAGVRVHHDHAAERAAAERHANAYAVGEHVVLGTGADHTLLTHELAHVVQQRRGGRRTAQHDDRKRPQGIGRTPPRVDYDVVREPAPREDLRVLFAPDSAELPALALAGLLPLLPPGAQTVRVDIDGYASREGDDEYNLNLSAHRAAAIQAALALILPPGSEVRLHAHGETGAFGPEPAGNRRAGIRVGAVPSRLPVNPPTLFSPRRTPSIVPELELHLDPDLLRPRWRPGDPPPDLQLPGASPRTPFTPVVPPPHVVVPPIPPIPSGGPFQPYLFPGLVPQRPAVDWTGIRQGALTHGRGTIDPGLRASIESTVESQYHRNRALGLDHGMAERLANLAVSSELNRQLAAEGNTAIDRSNNELARQGISTTTVPILTPEVVDRIRRIFGGGGGR